jgi:YggT family protein
MPALPLQPSGPAYWPPMLADASWASNWERVEAVLTQIILLLASTVCDLLSIALLARFALQAARASFRNPLGQFLLAATNWMVIPLRRIVPSAFGYDSASLLLAWLWQMIYVASAGILGSATLGLIAVSIPGVLIVGLFETLKLMVYLAMAVVLIAAIFSWVNPHAPMAEGVNQLARPMLRPFRRLVPPLGGIDLSPLVLLLVLQIVLIVLSSLRNTLLTLL